GGRARLKTALAEGNVVVRLQVKIGALSATRCRQRDAASELLLEEPRRGHMIGVHVGLERVLKLEPQLLDKRRVAPRLLEYRIDEHRFAARVVGEQIR